MNNISFIEISAARSSVRRYADRPVTDGEINAILEAARLAPSSNNTQPWRFVVVRDTDTINALSRAAPKGFAFNRKWLSKAPCVILCCGEPALIYHKAVSSMLPSELLTVDVTIAAEHIVLAAAEMGLGTCWVGWLTEKSVRKVLDLPKSWRVLFMLAVGWPERPLAARNPKRKRLSEIAFRENARTVWNLED